GGLVETSRLLGAGLRPLGKPMESPPYPTIACAPHFYPGRCAKHPRRHNQPSVLAPPSLDRSTAERSTAWDLAGARGTLGESPGSWRTLETPPRGPFDQDP